MFLSSEPESGGPQARTYQTHEFLLATVVPLVLCLGMARDSCDKSVVISAVIGETEAQSDWKFIMLEDKDTNLPLQKIGPANTSLGVATGEPIAAPYVETIEAEQGGRAPRDGNSPPSPQIEREDAPPHSEYVLLLIKQGRHRMKFFSRQYTREMDRPRHLLPNQRPL